MIVGLTGGLAAKTEKSSDIGAGPLLSLPIPWSSTFSTYPSGCETTLFDFLVGDSTVGPKSDGFDSTDSFFGGGLGSKAGSVGGGPEEKYLPHNYI